MEQATLGGVPGAGEVHSRRVSEVAREYRGSFAFYRHHEAAIVRLLNSRDQVEYEGPVDGERRKLQVILTDLSVESGMADFQGKGEPY